MRATLWSLDTRPVSMSWSQLNNLTQRNKRRGQIGELTIGKKKRFKDSRMKWTTTNKGKTRSLTLSRHLILTTFNKTANFRISKGPYASVCRNCAPKRTQPPTKSNKCKLQKTSCERRSRLHYSSHKWATQILKTKTVSAEKVTMTWISGMNAAQA